MKNRETKLDPANIISWLSMNISWYIDNWIVFSVFTICLLHSLIFWTVEPHVTMPTEILWNLTTWPRSSNRKTLKENIINIIASFCFFKNEHGRVEVEKVCPWFDIFLPFLTFYIHDFFSEFDFLARFYAKWLNGDHLDFKTSCPKQSANTSRLRFTL